MTPTHPRHQQPQQHHMNSHGGRLDRSSVKYQVGVLGTFNFRHLEEGDLMAQPRLKESWLASNHRPMLLKTSWWIIRWSLNEVTIRAKKCKHVRADTEIYRQFTLRKPCSPLKSRVFLEWTDYREKQCRLPDNMVRTYRIWWSNSRRWGGPSPLGAYKNIAFYKTSCSFLTSGLVMAAI